VNRLRILHRQESRRRRHVLGIEQVLEHHRNAVQFAAWPLFLALLVERARQLQRLGLQRDDGVDVRPLLVVGRDAVQIQLDQLFGVERAGIECLVDVFDGRRLQIEGGGAGR